MTVTEARRAGILGVGSSAPRVDAPPKVRGEFAYAGDLVRPDMLYGHTVRSPHASARIVRVDIAAALAVAGVADVITAADVPGRNAFGHIVADQPVLAQDRVRFWGEPVAVVAADSPETARRAAALVDVEYEPLPAVVDARTALDDPAAPRVHEGGNVCREILVQHGDPDVDAPVVVRGEFEIGMQDQAPLQTESGLALPAGDGGVELHISSQWLHTDHHLIAESLDLPGDKVRLVNAGIGGAFGAREDITLHIHLCMLALRTGRPVRMTYTRAESFLAHPKRHPARLRYEVGATTEGDLVFVRADLLFDGGAYTSSSPAVCANATCFAAGPYRVPNARLHGRVAYTNNPVCGAMRGFGAVQATFASESMLDRLAARLGIDPVELRLRNAVGPGDVLPFGHRLGPATPVREVIEHMRALPFGAEAARLLAGDQGSLGPGYAVPGGFGATSAAGNLRVGVGYAAGYKNLLYSEGYPEKSSARIVVSRDGVALQSAAAEVGQGVMTLLTQIVRTELGVDDVTLLEPSTDVPSAGSSSASRQSWMSGGAAQQVCRAAKDELAARAAAAFGCPPEDVVVDGAVRARDGRLLTFGELLGDEVIDLTETYAGPPTGFLGANGQGEAHAAFMFVAHRAVVVVDSELGLVRVVELATSQDVGRAINPAQVVGQIEGGSAQGLGLALLEEVVVDAGVPRNANFTDYLLPTIADMPPVTADLVEEPEPLAPYGMKGVGEPPCLSSTPAIVAAVRAATGRELTRVPLRPDDIAGIGP